MVLGRLGIESLEKENDRTELAAVASCLLRFMTDAFELALVPMATRRGDK